jgi:DNA-binding GntR family transcriptional regulator
MTDAELDQLDAMLTDHATDSSLIAGRGYFQGAGDKDFHGRIARASGNPRLISMLEGELYSLLRLYRHRLSMRPGRPQDALDEHRAILAAMRTRDPDRAEAAMRAHIRNSSSAVAEVLATEAAAATAE